MENIGRLNRVFDWNCELTGQMSKIIEQDNEEGKQMRGLIDEFIQNHLKVNPSEALKLESAINGLSTLSCSAYLTLGFILGKNLDVTDPEALQEIRGLNSKIKDGGFFPFWPKENKMASDATLAGQSEAGR